tara:strand:+ start:227 stop:643 length:417 start_codon:yes stop_codon:yes gene_type:complete
LFHIVYNSYISLADNGTTETNGEKKMEEKKTYYMQDLYDQATDDLDDRIAWYKEEKEDYEIDDLIHEIADNNIPIYTYDLLQYASNNFDLIYKNDLCSEDADCVQIIQANIFEFLSDHLYNYIDNTIQVKTEGENDEK